MRIIEKFIKGKKSQETCEDALVYNDNFVAVIDGVSSKSNYSYEGMTTGKISSNIIKNIVENMDSKTRLNEFIDLVNSEYDSFYRKNSFNLDVSKYGLQSMAVVYSDYQKKIWLIGDCVAVVNGVIYENPKKSDIVLSELRSMLINAYLVRNNLEESQYFNNGDLARKEIEPLILEGTIFANKENSEWGYSVLNGGKIPNELIKIISVKDGDEVVLASDGYPQVYPQLEDSENYLKYILDKDPYCYKQYKSTKGVHKDNLSFDDRTYIRFEV